MPINNYFHSKVSFEKKNLFLKMSVNVDSAITTSDRRRDRQDDQIQQTTNQGSAVGGNNNNYHNNNSNETGAAATFALPGSTNQSTAELVAFVLLGEIVTVDGVDISLPLQHENFPPNFTYTILAAGREILLQRQFPVDILCDMEQNGNGLPQFNNQECASAVAQKLVQLQADVGEKFVEAKMSKFTSMFAIRDEATQSLQPSFVQCFIPSDEDAALPDCSILALLKPILDKTQSVVDIARIRGDRITQNVLSFPAVSQAFAAVGCCIAMAPATAESFCKRFVRVPTLLPCRMLECTWFPSNRSDIDEPHKKMNPHNVQNVTGCAGSGKKVNSMLLAASWRPSSVVEPGGLAILLDMNQNAIPDLPSLQDELERLSDEHLFDSRRHVCASALVHAIVNALSPYGTKARQEKIAPIQREAIERRDVGCYTRAFDELGIGADIGGKVVIVLDNMGPFPRFLRALSSAWRFAHCDIAKGLRVKSENLFIVATGAGIENTADSIRDSRTDYALWTPDTPRIFAGSLERLKKSGRTKNISKLAGVVLDTLCRPKTAQEKQNDEESNKVHNGRPCSDRYEDLEVLQKFACNFILRQNNLNSATSYFARMATHSARFAALALKKLEENADQSVLSAIQENNNNNNKNKNNNRPRRNFVAHCKDWTSQIIDEFFALHPFGRCDATALEHIAEAISIVLVRQEALIGDEHDRLCLKYGLLEDRARFSNYFAYKHDKVAKRASLTVNPYMKVLVVKKNSPRFRISEAFVAMFLFKMMMNSCTTEFVSNDDDNSNHENNDNDDDAQLLSFATADSFALLAALCMFKRIDNPPLSVRCWPLQAPLREFGQIELQTEKGQSYRRVERFYCDEHYCEPNSVSNNNNNNYKWLSPAFPGEAVWAEWRRIIIESGGVVVIVNGKGAAPSFSSSTSTVIVLAPGHVFLTLCKKHRDSEEEYDTTLTCTKKQDNGFSNNELREKLAECCRINNKHSKEEVKFVASVVVQSKEANVTSTTNNNNNNDKNNKTTPKTAVRNEVVVYATEENKSRFASFLYPVLSSGFADNGKAGVFGY